MSNVQTVHNAISVRVFVLFVVVHNSRLKDLLNKNINPTCEKSFIQLTIVHKKLVLDSVFPSTGYSLQYVFF